MRTQSPFCAELKRELGLGSTIILVVANMIGTGIFTTSGFIVGALADPNAMLICWIIGGVLALCGALCYGELGAMFPQAGGEYVFLRESFGRLPGFLSGWISLLVGFSAPIAAAAIAFASYFFSVLPGSLAQTCHLPLCEASFFVISPTTLLAVGTIVIFSVVQCYSLLLGSRIQNLLTGLKIAVILVFIVAGLNLGNGSTEHFFVKASLESVFSTEFASALIFVSFAYSGWNAAAYLGSEIKNPSKNIPLALFWGALSVMVLYLLLNVVFIYALPVSKMKGVVEVGAASALALFGQGLESVFSGAIALSLLSVISAMIMTGPRVYYAMAKDRLFFRLFGRVTRNHGAPAESILLQAAIAVLMVLTSSFEKLLIYIGFTLSLCAVFTVLGMMVIRLKGKCPDTPYRTFGYPVTPLLFILSNLWIVVFSIKANPTATLSGGGTIAIGILVFLGFNARAPRRKLREPVEMTAPLIENKKI